jgi:hypothetical protein
VRFRWARPIPPHTKSFRVTHDRAGRWRSLRGSRSARSGKAAGRGRFGPTLPVGARRDLVAEMLLVPDHGPGTSDPQFMIIE